MYIFTHVSPAFICRTHCVTYMSTMVWLLKYRSLKKNVQ